MKAYRFLQSNWTSGYGSEPPWTVGDERLFDAAPAPYKDGYPYGRDWLSALAYAPGPVACVVDVDDGPVDRDGNGVSRRCKLLAGTNCARELRLFAADCAERALTRERERGQRPDHRSQAAVDVARRYARGEATFQELHGAADDAARAADDAARAADDAATYAVLATALAATNATALAATDAAADDDADAAALAATDAAYNAADAALAASADDDALAASGDAYSAERDWQRQRLAELLDARIEARDAEGVHDD